MQNEQKVFELHSEYAPTGDQPQAIEALVKGFQEGNQFQTLLGVTGSGKTFTMANVIQQLNKPTLVIAHNKTLAAQLYGEFKEFFPNNAVEYFVSYYDYYQPEAYVPSTDTYIEKDSAINDEIDKLRHSATAALSERNDVIIVASVSCIYGLGSPIDYKEMVISLRPGMEKDRDEVIHKLIDIQSRMTEGKGIGYKRWLTKHNLKVMAQTVTLLQEKGLTDEDALNQRIAELETKYHDALAVVKDLEGRMKTNKELRYHVAAYTSTKNVAQQLKTAKRPAAFEEQHRAELTAYRAAAAYFKANSITKLPSPKKLEAEYAQLASEKAKFYEQYKEAKEELLKLKTAKQNVASFFREEEPAQQER